MLCVATSHFSDSFKRFGALRGGNDTGKHRHAKVMLQPHGPPASVTSRRHFRYTGGPVRRASGGRQWQSAPGQAVKPPEGDGASR